LEYAVKLAKLSDFHFHDLRHTFASYLAMNGATLAEIAESLGTKSRYGKKVCALKGKEYQICD